MPLQYSGCKNYSIARQESPVSILDWNRSGAAGTDTVNVGLSRWDQI